MRRVASTLTLAAQEYRIGVDAGRVVQPAEVEEARLFLDQARRYGGSLPVDAARAVASIDSIRDLVRNLAPAERVETRVAALNAGLAARYGIVLDEVPERRPDLVRGARLYGANCSGCHGDRGRGDGPMAAGLDPTPSNLADWAALRDQSPLDFYRRVSIGVAGTAMPPFEGRLSPEDRWAVALYASTLRLPAALGEVPAGLGSFAASARMADIELLDSLGVAADGSEGGLARLAAVRAARSEPSTATLAGVVRQARAEVDSAYALARTGSPGAGPMALAAYLTFEGVERDVRNKDARLARDLEADFAALRVAAERGAGADLDVVRTRLVRRLDRAGELLGRGLSPLNLFVQSFIIMLREGLEAILIVGALMTFLAKMGAADRRRHIGAGVAAAVGASVLTAIALETVFRLSAAHQEAIEGATMLLATVVLFYVSYWLLSKMEVVKWTHFVKSKVHHAVTSGSALALASAAFLAVYREGFETVLFYKALVISAGAAANLGPIAAGALAGGLILIAVYLAIHRFGVRLPLKPFFAVTSAFLYYMAFTFAGAGIVELQEAGWAPATPVLWAPRIPALGIYPTLESLAAQGTLLALALVALVWTFVVEPRRSLAAALRHGSDEAVRA